MKRMNIERAGKKVYLSITGVEILKKEGENEENKKRRE